MKRRKFIQASLVAAVAPTAGGAERLYGTPASVLPGGVRSSERFMLPLSKTGLPSSTWGEFSQVCDAIERVMTSKAEAALFAKNPRGYLTSRGLDASDRTLMDDSVIMLTCLSHSSVQSAFADRNYDKVLKLFDAAGLFEPRDPSALAQRIQDVLASNATEIRKLIGAEQARLRPDQEQVLLQVLRESGAQLTEDDFTIVSELVSSGVVSPQACTAVAACAVAVVLVAIAAAYVSVGVGATVGLMVGFSVSIAVQLAVFGYEPTALPTAMATSDVPFTGAMTKLDPVLVRNAERAMKLSAFTGDNGLRKHVMRDLISVEVEAFLRAMQRANLIQADEEHLVLATKATTAYAYRVGGL